VRDDDVERLARHPLERIGDAPAPLDGVAGARQGVREGLRVRRVVLRGKPVVEDGEVLARPGSGLVVGGSVGQ
ncbi:MAG TPA: hypothetical protein PKE20_03405, partial [Promineifilum sp.]|nr:hypothetical protein [Promineifilum sp.]